MEEAFSKTDKQTSETVEMRSKKVTLQICLAPLAVEASNICGSEDQIGRYGSKVEDVLGV